MKYLKTYQIFESGLTDIDSMEEDIKDILQELEDDGFVITIDRHTSINGSKLKNIFLEIYVKKPWGSPDRVVPDLPAPPSGKYPGNIFFWREVKESIIRLVEWYYSNKHYTPGINYNISKELQKMGIKIDNSSPLRMFCGGVEFGIGWSNEDDFKNFEDTISFTNLRLLMRF